MYVGMLGMLARSRARWVFIIWYLCDSLAVARKRGKHENVAAFLSAATSAGFSALCWVIGYGH